MRKSLAIFALFFLVNLSAEAQRIATWKGGQTGRPRDWNCPTNWKEGRVPNEFSNVVIPDVSTSTFCYPLIDNQIVEVFGLQCDPNAYLNIIGNGRVIILDSVPQSTAQRNEGMTHKGKILDGLAVSRN